MRTLENRLAQGRLEVNLLGAMFSVFAAIALVLASVGLYAVIANSVSQRTQEIGVRMAMGGTRGDILKLVFAQGMRPLALGVAIGLPAAFGIIHVLRMALIGVSPSDPMTFLAVTLLLTLAVSSAARFPPVGPHVSIRLLRCAANRKATAAKPSSRRRDSRSRARPERES